MSGSRSQPSGCRDGRGAPRPPPPPAPRAGTRARVMIEDAPRLAGRRAQDVAWRVHGAPPQAVSGPRYVGLVTRAIACVIDVAIVNAVAALVAAAVALVISVFHVSHAL